MQLPGRYIRLQYKPMSQAALDQAYTCTWHFHRYFQSNHVPILTRHLYTASIELLPYSAHSPPVKHLYSPCLGTSTSRPPILDSFLSDAVSLPSRFQSHVHQLSIRYPRSKQGYISALAQRYSPCKNIRYNSRVPYPLAPG